MHVMQTTLAFAANSVPLHVSEHAAIEMGSTNMTAACVEVVAGTIG